MLGSWVHTFVPIACQARRLRPVVTYQRSERIPRLMRSYLPSHEANCFNNGRLDNLFTREDTPGNGIWPLTVCIGSQITALVDCIVRDKGVTFNLCQQRGEVGGRYEELEVRLEGRSQDVSAIYVSR